MPEFYAIANYPFDLQVESFGQSALASALQESLARVLYLCHLSQKPQNPVVFHSPFKYTTPYGVLQSVALTTHYQFRIHLNPQAASVDMVELVDVFEPELFNQAIRETPGELLWIHGACLVRDDELILLVAETGTGKTTLSLGLLAHGYQLLTDDIVLVDLESRCVLPVLRCPKYRDPAPLLLASVGFELPETLGHYVLLPPACVQAAPAPLPIAKVYIMQRSPDRTPGAQDLSLTDGLLALLPHSNLLAIDPDLSLAHDLFAHSQFMTLNLEDYQRDLGHIVGG